MANFLLQAVFLSSAIAGILSETRLLEKNDVPSGSLASLPGRILNKAELSKFSKKMNETVTELQSASRPGGIIDQTVRFNFMSALFAMANHSAITGSRVSRAAGTIIRGFVQDSFNLVSIGFYLPRLIFLDGPSQFIEILRLTRAGQIRIPQDIDEAFDTIINFASIVRESQIAGNLGTPFLHFFPNVFRGAELLSTEVLFGVFSWLGPINPADISSASVEGLWNRWDVKSSTTSKYDSEKRYQANGGNPNLYERPWFEEDSLAQSTTTDAPTTTTARPIFTFSNITDLFTTNKPLFSFSNITDLLGFN